MAHSYKLTSTPVLVDIGKASKATVRASVPFFAGSALHCPNYTHNVGTGRHATEVFHAVDGAPSGLLTVWPGR
jgi:hypothetical protein